MNEELQNFEKTESANSQFAGKMGSENKNKKQGTHPRILKYKNSGVRPCF